MSSYIIYIDKSDFLSSHFEFKYVSAVFIIILKKRLFKIEINPFDKIASHKHRKKPKKLFNYFKTQIHIIVIPISKKKNSTNRQIKQLWK